MKTPFLLCDSSYVLCCLENPCGSSCSWWCFSSCFLRSLWVSLGCQVLLISNLDGSCYRLENVITTSPVASVSQCLGAAAGAFYGSTTWREKWRFFIVKTTVSCSSWLLHIFPMTESNNMWMWVHWLTGRKWGPCHLNANIHAYITGRFFV